MTSEFDYATVAEVRKRAHSINTTEFSDSDIEIIITGWENIMHKQKARTVVYPASIDLKIAKRAVVEGAASEILLSFDDYIEDGKEAKSRYDSLIAILP
ncbi:hypothetical protein YTPLAS73_09020 [Nitrosarchaeum sp.]|nr:hypothetical protein YTPLAS73_09020 [Nitrosarchaeum sp.]